MVQGGRFLARSHSPFNHLPGAAQGDIKEDQNVFRRGGGEIPNGASAHMNVASISPARSTTIPLPFPPLLFFTPCARGRQHVVVQGAATTAPSASAKLHSRGPLWASVETTLTMTSRLTLTGVCVYCCSNNLCDIVICRYFTTGVSQRFIEHIFLRLLGRCAWPRSREMAHMCARGP